MSNMCAYFGQLPSPEARCASLSQEALCKVISIYIQWGQSARAQACLTYMQAPSKEAQRLQLLLWRCAGESEALCRWAEQQTLSSLQTEWWELIGLGVLQHQHQHPLVGEVLSLFEQGAPGHRANWLLQGEAASRAERWNEAEEWYLSGLDHTEERVFLRRLMWLYRHCRQPVSARNYATTLLQQAQQATTCDVEEWRQLASFFRKSKQRRTKQLIKQTLSDAFEADTQTLLRLFQQPMTDDSPKDSAPRLLDTFEHAAKVQLGFASLRPEQRELLSALATGKHVFGVLPTGAGKSLCYQLPAFVNQEGTTLVISPLLSLIDDQLANLPPLWREQTLALHHHQGVEQWERRQAISEGRYKLIYAAPERLKQMPLLFALRQAPIKLMVIDEVHCMSMWGNAFRPDYLQLPKWHQALGTPQLLLLTATAPPMMREELLEHFPQEVSAQTTIIAKPARRPDLFLSVQRSEHKQAQQEWLLSLCQSWFQRQPGKNTPSGLLFSNTRASCEAWEGHLKALGLRAAAYHAGLPDRSQRQAAFLQGDIDLLVATVAFGMGIDKPDIRFVAHDGLPSTIEDYCQQIGRASRDKQGAHCLLCYCTEDIEWREQRLTPREEHLDRLRSLYRAIRAEWNTQQEGFVELEALAFQEGLSHTQLQVSLELLQHADIIQCHQGLPQHITLQRMDHFAKPGMQPNPSFDTFIHRLRVPPRGAAHLNTQEISARTGIPIAQVEWQCLTWEAAGLIAVEAYRRGTYIKCLPAPPKSTNRVQTLLAKREQTRTQRWQALRELLSTHLCRHQTLDTLLGEHSSPQPCNSCDFCTQTIS